METPTPPTPPDPREIARTEAEFNRIDQFTPFGSLTFSGPNRNIATQEFSPELQGLFGQRLESDQALLASALERQQLLQNQPIDLSQFGPIQSQIDTTGINFQGPQFGDLPQLTAPDLQTVGQGPGLQQGVGTFGVPQLEQLTRDIAPGGDIQSRVTSPFDIQGQVDTGLDTSGLPGIPQDPNQFRGDVERAVFERGRALLDPVFADQQRALTQRLANQGLPRSGEAVEREQTRFGDVRSRAFTDLANQAVISGGQEASRSLGDILAARGAGFGEQVTGANLGLAGGQFANQAAGQGFGQNLAAGQFGNLAQQQGFGQDFTRAGFGNQAGLSQFGAGLQGAQFGLGQNLAAGQFGNQALQQGFQNQLTGTGFNNQAGLLGLGAQQGIRGQLTNEQFAQAQAGNQASQLNLGLQQQLLQNQNAARSQGLFEEQGVRGNQFNELASLLGLQQVQAPQLSSFFSPGQADVTGAFGLNQQGQQFNFQQQQNQNNALMSGLFGLGGSVLGGPIGGAIGSSIGGLFGGGGGLGVPA